MVIITPNADEVKISLTEYRDAAKSTAGNCNNLYLTMGMVGETGEVIDVLKKIIRDINNGKAIQDSLAERKEKLEDELGDVLWYCVVYNDENVNDNIVFAGEVDIDLGAAIRAALDLAMITAEYANLTFNHNAAPSEGAMYSILCDIHDICIATGLNIYDVMRKNIAKLSKRYADGFKLGVK